MNMLIPALSLILGFLFRGLFYNHALGISGLIFAVAVLAAILLTSRVGHLKLPRQIWWPSAGLLFFASLIFWRASFALTFWNVILTLILTTLIVATGRGWSLVQTNLMKYLGIVFQPFVWLGQGMLAVVDGFAIAAKPEKRIVTRRILTGIFLAIPFLFLFGLLFAGADPIFADYLKKVFRFEFDFEVILQILLVTLITLLAAGALRVLTSQSEPSVAPKPMVSKTPIGAVETITVLVLVDLLFAAFIVVQFAYLFNGGQTVGPDGLTYAEYARHGVNELTLVALVALALQSVAMTASSQAEQSGQRRAFRLAASLLAIGILVVMFSANYRLGLYEDAYGFTTTRLYGHAFIWWLGLVFLLVLGRIHIPRLSERFLAIVGLSVIGVLTILNLANPDAMIARANIAKFGATEKQDTDYLVYQLSDDALPVVVGLLDQGDEVFRRRLARGLNQRLENLQKNQKERAWFAYHWGREQARRALESHAGYPTEHKDYQVQVEIQPSTHLVELRNIEGIITPAP